MTDNDITKAFEEWIKELKDDYKRLQLLGAPMDCFEESHIDKIRVLSNALDLFNRQKAEIDNLNKDLSDTIALNYKERQGLKTKIEEQRFVISCMETGRVILERQRKNAWDTAIRKFAEGLKEKACKLNMCHNEVVIKTDYQISCETLDSLVKEMVGDV